MRVRLLTLALFFSFLTINANPLTKGIKEIGQECVEYIGKFFGKKLTKEAFREMAESEARRSSLDMAESTAKRIMSVNWTSSKVLKNAIENVTAKNAVEIVSTKLSSAAASRWNTIAAGNVDHSMCLAKDLLKNSDLTNAINKNPMLLDDYIKNIGSPAFRSDVTMLRYMNGRANLYDNKSSIKIVSKYGVDCVLGSNDEMLGTIRHSGDGYIVNVSKDNNMLLNMPLFQNSQYIVSRDGFEQTIKTNKNGLTTSLDVTLDGKQCKPNPNNRNNKVIAKYRDISKEMTLDGHMNSENHNLVDDGGHIVPRSWGGLDEGSNLFAQNKNFNQKGIWKNNELAGDKALGAGETVKLHIEFVYPENSRRPSYVYRKQTHNGKVVCDDVMENVKEHGGHGLLSGVENIINLY